MKIEKINDNQIKCTLTRSDLASRQLKLSELTYGTEKARGLFQDMMDQANLEFGFDADDIPLMVEAIPVSMDCIILMITKVEDPDEVDTRFSTLSNLKDMFSYDLSEDFSSDSMEDDFTEDLQDFRLGDLSAKKARPAVSGTERIFSFDTLETVIDFAGHNRDCALRESSLYKSPDDGRFYLHITGTAEDSEDFARICSSAIEFGTSESVSYARTAYMNEHFEKILGGNAVQSLAYV